MPKENKVLVLDSLDVKTKRYSTILNTIRAIKIGIEKYNLPFHPEREYNIQVSSKFPQPRGTGYRGYNVCEYLRVDGRYRTHPEDLPKIPKTSRPLTETNLMNIIADLCRFTMHEVINRRGEFFDHDSFLATEEKYRRLVQWEYHPF
ncbi:hypothetical protein BS78_10G158500 [Paspalum vaginatum]|nr:hypothetical protein BS78_10G158500 [Paspalum vaginatum]